MTVAALVVGAGRGQRLHESARAPDSDVTFRPEPGLAKAFVRLAGRSLLARSVEALARAPEVDVILAVLPPDGVERWGEVAAELSEAARARCLEPVAGGAERVDSVGRGLAALPADVEHVAVHDAARPLVRPEDVSRVVRAAVEHGAALLAVPVADTIHRIESDAIAATPRRDECWAAQTPQVFRVDWLREALHKARAGELPATDDAGLVAALGLPVRVVDGDPGNRKITRAEDLAWAETRLREQAAKEERG